MRPITGQLLTPEGGAEDQEEPQAQAGECQHRHTVAYTFILMTPYVITVVAVGRWLVTLVMTSMNW